MSWSSKSPKPRRASWSLWSGTGWSRSTRWRFRSSWRSAWARTGERRIEPPGASNSWPAQRVERFKSTECAWCAAGRWDDREYGRGDRGTGSRRDLRRGGDPGSSHRESRCLRGARGAVPRQGLSPRPAGAAQRRVRPGCGPGRLSEGVQRPFPIPGPVELLHLALPVGDESMPRHEAPRQVRSPRGVGGRGDWREQLPIRCCRRRWPACASSLPPR